jgi:chemotaxis family two-component system sensor kinase Cph1
VQWAIMNINPLIKETNAVITSDPLPSIHADQAQVAQLFQHLLTNSIKFRGEASPQVQVSATRQDETLHRFSVRDNGIGIDKEFHERVFGAFKRLHGKEVPGTGIGLAICRKIVEAHGGRIWIESEAGSGAVVHFTLPTSD